MNDYLEMMKSATTEVVNAVNSKIDGRILHAEACSRGKSVRIIGVSNDTDLYIRIVVGNEGIIADFNNLYIDKRFQRRGLLTLVMETVYNLDSINAVVVSSVISKSMAEFCIKHGFKESVNYDGFILTK